VLALAGGPNAGLLCRAWCDPHAAAASGCHEDSSSTSPTLSDTGSCDDVMLVTAAAIREDVRRAPSPIDAQQAIQVPRFLLAPSTTDSHNVRKPREEWPLEKRPLSPALRI
jgi:hypothetical protein